MTTNPTAHTIRLGANRTGLELRMFTREKEAVFFTFLLPIVLLALFSVVFGDSFAAGGDEAGVSAARYFLPAMVASGVILTSFQSTALSVAMERDDGLLKRLRSTPMPPSSFFLGKVGLVVVTSATQTLVLLAVARLAFGVPLPQDAEHWLTFAWVLLLGVAGGTVLGIAFSSVASARSAGAVVIGPVLLLQFISGVYFPYSQIPTWLQQVAAVFPLKWVAQGMRSVFLPDDFASLESAGAWEHGRTAVVLLLWFIGGLVVCLRTFRWFKRGTT
ncbi:putative transporter [Nostocoides japonicum T1-X7]|uniref:Transport permease protein n=1 Tax=Nostocoides japonicum T1-X7 TaxID=1194083 RepID=A0A077M2N9_9MICO|nr:ABC transporter permease [Tetrasphaera japonica]CCH79312.1 putative transporter [Tetrasphaera japonica T1-X7]